MCPLLIISLLLAFVGGYADAASFVLTKSFTGHLTGNTVLTMVHLVEGAWRDAAANMLAVAGFVVGTAWADGLNTDAGSPSEAKALRVPLLLQGVCLLAATVSLWQSARFGLKPALACLCIGMGLQNGALRKCGGISVHTTFITGLSTSLLAPVVQEATGQKKLGVSQRRSVAVWTGIIAGFAGGALVGGCLSWRYRAAGLVGIFVPWAVAVLLTGAPKVPNSSEHPSASIQ